MKHAFGHHLKMLRRQRGMSQIELAQKTGLTASSISHFEAGDRQPCLQNFFTIVEALNTTSDYFMGWNNKTMLDATGLSGKKIKMAEAFIKFLATHKEDKE